MQGTDDEKPGQERAAARFHLSSGLKSLGTDIRTGDPSCERFVYFSFSRSSPLFPRPGFVPLFREVTLEQERLSDHHA
ncbi:MAG: hypothetical protein ABR524_14675, partial [Thermoanaerobaculia bacterium]